MKNPQLSIKNSKIHQLLNLPDSATIQAPSAQDIAQAKAMSDSYASMQKTETHVTALLAACAMLSVIWFVLTAETFAARFAGIFWTMACVVAMFACNRIFEVLLNNVKAVQQALAPLEGLETCERALTLAKQVPACNNYRDTVLSQGREFLNVDLMLMEKMAAYQRTSAYKEQSRNVCKELHGIPA